MRDAWDRKYHLNELTRASGCEWVPKPDSLEDAMASVAIARRVSKTIHAVERVLSGCVLGALLSIIVGIGAGVFSVFATTGPVEAFVVVGILTLILSLGARFWMGVYVAPRFDNELRIAEAAYRAELDRQVSS